MLANLRRDCIRVGKASIELVNGECVSILDQLEPRSVDAVVTSPPYNLGIDYEAYDDKIDREEYLAWSLRWLRAARRVLSPAGSLFLNMGGKPSDPLGPEQVLLKAVEAGFVAQNKIYWVKSIALPVDGRERTFGHFKPLNSPRFLNDCVEMIYHLTREGDVPIDRVAVGVEYEDKSNLSRGTRGKNGDRRCRGNAWFIPYETIQNRDKDRPHPATYPVELAERCFRLHGLERIKITLDPFSGLGNTAIASARLGLNHVGIEIDPKAHDEAVRRVRELQS